MYWRVQKVSVEQLGKTYGVYVVCILSVFFNLILLAKMPSANKLSAQQKSDFEGFAKEVTRHLSDSGFMTYSTSMTKLAYTSTHAELSGNVIKMLTPDVIPPTPDHMKAIDRRLKESKSVSQVSIDDVKVSEPDPNRQGLVPIEIGGRVVRSSAGEVTGPDPFRFKFWVGEASKKDDPNDKWLTVVDLKDISGQAQPPPGQQ
jgi:hypothetical protein